MHFTSRMGDGPISNWWWTVDKYLLLLILILTIIGITLVFSASSAVAVRIGTGIDHFVIHHIVFVFIAMCTMGCISFFNTKQIKIFATVGYCVFFMLLIYLLLFGSAIKGSRRWIYIAGISVQPSEFIKPFFAVVIALILSYVQNIHKAYIISGIMYLMTVLLLILQPDFGMVITITIVYAVQLFVYGLPIRYCMIASVVSLMGMVLAYLTLPHVKSRILRFLDSDNSSNFQVEKSLESFHNGGLYGIGPGEGVIKFNLPDAHTDFIFALAGEEFGGVTCILILSIFIFMILRGLIKAIYVKDMFMQLMTVGIWMQIVTQVFVNVCVTLKMVPAKGMTLPLISYGGSSSVAIGVAFGMIFGN